MSDVVALADVCAAIADTLGAAAGLARTQEPDELTEGMNDLPTLQVYPESGLQDAAHANDRTTFKAGLQNEEAVIHADLYVRQRSQLGEDMGALVTQHDAIRTALKAVREGPFFGLAGIKTFRWAWRRVLFEYGDPAVRYVGVRYEITVRLF